MRTLKEEIELRTQQRTKYFEDPNYQKWSSIARIDRDEYGELSDFYLFHHYILHPSPEIPGNETIAHSMNHHTNPHINLNAVYSYFDERLNDKDNALKQELEYPTMWTDKSLSRFTVKQILDKYRTVALESCYDMV